MERVVGEKVVVDVSHAESSFGSGGDIHNSLVRAVADMASTGAEEKMLTCARRQRRH